jgi:hypothetical protein
MAQTANDKQPSDDPPARRGWVVPLGAEASVASASAFVRAGFSDPTLVLRWNEIAGEETARLARPIRLTEGPSGGVLTLKAEPGAALFLQHESRALCERINAYLGRPAVAKLRFVQGILATAAKPNRPVPKAGALQPGDPAKKYQGPEGLRAALLGLAGARRRPDTAD